MERLTVSKQAAQKADEEAFNLRKLNELEFKKQYQIKISNKSAGSENLYDSEDIKSVWETLRKALEKSVMKLRVP
jgi:uncharacterized Zn finger protein